MVWLFGDLYRYISYLGFDTRTNPLGNLDRKLLTVTVTVNVGMIRRYGYGNRIYGERRARRKVLCTTFRLAAQKFVKDKNV
jgi:hypothetical protein